MATFIFTTALLLNLALLTSMAVREILLLFSDFEVIE